MEHSNAEVKQLFGGAITCAIPTDFDDVSAFRQVPDHQEVFANAKTDQSVIIELLQMDDSVPHSECALAIFKDLASANACNESQISILHSEALDVSSPPIIPMDCHKSIIIGDQWVAKFKEGDDARNVVRVYLGVIRLPSVSTDIAISVSVPMQIHPKSSSHGCFQYENSSDIGLNIFKAVFSSFTVKDLSLFG